MRQKKQEVTLTVNEVHLTELNFAVIAVNIYISIVKSIEEKKMFESFQAVYKKIKGKSNFFDKNKNNRFPTHFALELLTSLELMKGSSYHLEKLRRFLKIGGDLDIWIIENGFQNYIKIPTIPASNSGNTQWSRSLKQTLVRNLFSDERTMAANEIEDSKKLKESVFKLLKFHTAEVKAQKKLIETEKPTIMLDLSYQGLKTLVEYLNKMVSH